MSLPLLASGLFLGCGEPPGDPNAAAIETDPSALVAGAINVSNGIVPNSIVESETAAAGIGNVLAVAMNSIANPNPPNERCVGTSVAAMIYGAGGTLTHGMHFGTSPGTALYRGNPSMAAFDPGASSSSYTVFVTNMGTSTAKWNTLPKLADGCISSATWGATAPDQLCLFTIAVPKTGAAGALFSSVKCVTPGAVGGTAVAAQGGVAYMATWDASSRLIFYRGDGTLLEQPLPGKSIRGLPIFTKNGGLDLFAPDSAGTFWETAFNTATGHWTAPIAAPSPSPFVFHSKLPFGMSSTTEYAAISVPGANGPGNVYLFYRNGAGQLVGYSHSTSSIPGWALAFTSPSGVQAFHPAVAVASVPGELGMFTGNHLALSYWDNSVAGGLALKYTNSLTVTPTRIASETPCPHQGYWGDYDEMAVLNNNTSNPTFERFFTDSTGSTCSDTSDFSATTPQHVSMISHAR